MKRSQALLKWKLPVIWVAGSEGAPALGAAAETAPAAPPQVVHYHLHLPPGTDLSGLSLELSPGGAVSPEEGGSET